MAILVTGGAGYIGSVMVEVLRERGVAGRSRGQPLAGPSGGAWRTMFRSWSATSRDASFWSRSSRARDRRRLPLRRLEPGR